MIGSITDWRTYAAERGDTAPTDADDAIATQALVRASDYIETVYVLRFVLPHGVTSVGVEQAAYIAASLELSTPGFFSLTYTPSQQKLLTEVKGIKWTPVGGASGSDAATPRSTMIEALLGRYMTETTATGGLTPFLGVVG